MGRGDLLGPRPDSRWAEQCCRSGPAPSLCVLPPPDSYLVAEHRAAGRWEGIRGSPARGGWGWGPREEKRVFTSAYTSVFMQVCLCGHVCVSMQVCQCVPKCAQMYVCVWVLHVEHMFMYAHNACLLCTMMCAHVSLCMLVQHTLMYPHPNVLNGARLCVCVCSARVCMHLSLRVHMGTCICLCICLHGLFHPSPRPLLSPHVSRSG